MSQDSSKYGIAFEVTMEHVEDEALTVENRRKLISEGLATGQLTAAGAKLLNGLLPDKRPAVGMKRASCTWDDVRERGNLMATLTDEDGTVVATIPVYAKLFSTGGYGWGSNGPIVFGGTGGKVFDCIMGFNLSVRNSKVAEGAEDRKAQVEALKAAKEAMRGG